MIILLADEGWPAGTKTGEEYMYDVNFHRADSINDAISKLGSADDGKLLSGGQTLIPTMKQRLAAPSDIIDITGIPELSGVCHEQLDGEPGFFKKIASMFGGGENPVKITIGAATTHAEVAGSDTLRENCPGLAALASGIGDPHVRHKGTIGGSIANNDPAADYPSAMLALNAEITTNKRAIAADDFFTGMFETALEDDEMVTSISFVAPQKAAYAKFPNPASRYAMAGVFVAAGVDGVRVAVTGAGSDGVFRHSGMETALSTNWSADAVASCDVDEGAMLSDLHGDAAYRANLVKVMARRAVEKAG